MTTLRRTHTPLPKFLKPFFWQYDFRDLSWEEDRDLVIAHLLAHGDWPAIQWLRQQLSSAELRAWITERRGRGLDPPRLRFWELILDLPHRQVNQWMADLRENPWFRRWTRS